jgi:hypothetical protein
VSLSRSDRAQAPVAAVLDKRKSSPGEQQAGLDR